MPEMETCARDGGFERGGAWGAMSGATYKVRVPVALVTFFPTFPDIAQYPYHCSATSVIPSIYRGTSSPTSPITSVLPQRSDINHVDAPPPLVPSTRRRKGPHPTPQRQRQRQRQRS